MKKMIALVVLVAASILLPVTAAQADPNVESVLPADGVLSIERSGDVWTATFDTAPWEFKVISNPQQIVCGTNYGDPCSTTETFTWAAGCLYTQVDWSNGSHTSTDPYVCRDGEPPVDTPVEVCWLLPQPGTESDVTWPQTYVPDCVPPCESTLQVDKYPSQAIADRLTADGILTKGEDYDVVVSWRWIVGGTCEPEVEYGEWSYGKPACGFDTVTDTREMYTTIIFPGGERGETTTKVEAAVRPITDAEKTALGLCGKLALTGYSDSMPFWAVVALTLIAIGAVIAAVRLKWWRVFRKPAGLHKAVR